jgi:hypothetical protein
MDLKPAGPEYFRGAGSACAPTHDFVVYRGRDEDGAEELVKQV